MENKYIKNLTKTFMSSCNPNSRRFYDSKMLQNSGKLIINYPEINEVVETNNDFPKIVEE